ncbi:MAG: SDR family oxidoreductase [Bdellovibrionota bacterium]
MEHRTALITGCSSGFGRDLVRELLSRNWRVIATMRNLQTRSDLFADELATPNSRLTVLEMDVTSATDRSAVLERVGSITGGSLDCLINNAGYGLFGAFEDSSEEQIRAQLEVNFFGLALLTRDTLPMLRSSRGKIIQLSSILGLVGTPLSSLYSASKFAVEGLSEALAHELAPFGVQVCIVEPGGHRTDFAAKLVWADRGNTNESPYRKRSDRYRTWLARALEEKSTPPSPAVRKIASLAERKHLPLRVRCGWDATALYGLRCVLPDRIFIPLARAVIGMMFYRE